jgi:hypothetical protein
MHPVLRFTLLCSALALGPLLALWAVTGFSAFGMTLHGVVAMVLAAVVSVGLASALMGLLFHSEHLGRGERPPPR